MQSLSPCLTPATVITSVRTPEEARSLPKGSLVGDEHGGLTFSDDVARILEQRSVDGWIEYPPGDPQPSWTVIHLNRS